MPKPALQSDLRLRHQAPQGTNFRRALGQNSPDEHKESHPMHAHWMEYALDTNKRGDEQARFMAAYMPLSGKRHLDIGSAYGGTPIAFSKAGAYAYGIEIDPKLYRLGLENLADHPGLPCMLVLGDILDDEIADSIGKFDIITCSNVIEHVSSTAKLLATMRRLLRPGGFCNLLIPNPFSYEEVRRDGHYGLFGLTLLSRANAEEYFHAAGNTTSYDVGEYCFTYAEYKSMFRTAGLTLELIDPTPWNPKKIETLRQDHQSLRGEAQIYQFPNSAVRTQVLCALDTYIAKANQAIEQYYTAPRAEQQMHGEDVLREYRQSYWSVLARATD